MLSGEKAWHGPEPHSAAAPMFGPARQASDYLNALRRRWWIVVALTIIAVAGAVGISMTSKKEYDATATVLLSLNDALDNLGNPTVPRSLDPERDVNTGVALVKLDAVASRVREQLRLRLTPSQLLAEVRTGTAGNSNLIKITARDRSPARAADIANAFAADYVSFRRRAARDRYDEAGKLVQRQIAALSTADQAEQTGRNLRAKLRQLQLAATLQTGGVQFVEAAGIPTKAATPRPVFNGAVGGLIGLFIGLLLAVGLEFADRRLKDEAEVESLVALPVLAAIPQPRRSLWGGTDTLRQEEAYRTLAINLRVLSLGVGAGPVLITSARSGEGKTSVTLGVAAALASLDQRVLAIEADLRHPSFARYLGLPERGGLTMVVAGLSDLTSQLVEVDASTGKPISSRPSDGPSFSVLSAGAASPNPLRLLSSMRMQMLLDEASSMSDVVLIDTTSLTEVGDPLSFAGAVGSSVLVVRLNAATRDGTRRALRTLGNAGFDIAGLVVTGGSTGLSYSGSASETLDLKPSAGAAAWLRR